MTVVYGNSSDRLKDSTRDGTIFIQVQMSLSGGRAFASAFRGAKRRLNECVGEWDGGGWLVKPPGTVRAFRTESVVGDGSSLVGRVVRVWGEFNVASTWQLSLRKGDWCEVVNRFNDSLGRYWVVGRSTRTNRVGLVPLTRLSPACGHERLTTAPAHTDGIYTVHAAYPKTSPSGPANLTTEHPLHMSLTVDDQVHLLNHNIRNHLYVYGRKVSTLEEGWFPIFGTVKGAFKVVGRLPDAEVGSWIDADAVYGFELVRGTKRGGSQKVRVPLFKLDAVVI
ncbi:hypothetical protein BJ742DRAFT_568643 [Cladochytrium replicatum]|nr:hypothetical protein BJ742DRAFT_568643 [Cladochytrium replicatum]